MASKEYQMMLNGQEIVDGNMVVEGYEEVDVMNELVVQSEEPEEITFDDDDVRSDDGDGYGGMSVDQYNDIVEYKRTGAVPRNIDKRMDRSAPSHWRSRCNRFTMADDNVTLLYYNPTSPVNDQPKVVVKKGEVRKVLERIHEIIGHLGQKRTQMVVLRKLYWRSVRQDVKQYIMSCEFCNQKKIEGRKIVKAPVDITSDNFDINVAVRDTQSGACDRLEFTLIGYNEQEVRDAAYTRMTSYTFKETANEFRSRFTLRDTPAPTFRRQPYVKRNGNMAIGYLLPFQQRSRAMEPEFIEIYERQNVPYEDTINGEEYEEQVVEEMVEPMKQGANEDAPIAHPVTLDGQVLQSKKYFKMEEADVEVDVGDNNRAEVEKMRKLQKENVGEPSSSNQEEIDVVTGQGSTSRHLEEEEKPPHLVVAVGRTGTRYEGRKRVPVHHEEVYPPEEHHHQQQQQQTIRSAAQRRRMEDSRETTTTANLVKKRREAPSFNGMASRFSMAVGDTDRLIDNDSRTRQLMENPFDGQASTRTEFCGLPPICMMPSLDSEVILMQKEMLQRQICLQKQQEKLLQAQYDLAMRIPMTRYVQPNEHQLQHVHEEIVQEEAIEVDHELNVIDEHTVYEGEEHIHHEQ